MLLDLHDEMGREAVARAALRALFFAPKLVRAVVVAEPDGTVHVRGESRQLEFSIGVELQPQQMPALCERLRQLGVAVFAAESDYAKSLAA
ncbi:hypothetical protein LNV09_19830 [Paucibacter sp. B2R-40]|uniref:hypothetical protein n=1 Tax=Paucibacter sp. B2R-40 TaxID=2893554 RepID=UPI0021E42E2A|nr:hypothetical protein [Paucibacter sp. B2R-40]MCV2356396.1 hypothetical protein [Paucibacter sp. B2R-40]